MVFIQSPGSALVLVRRRDCGQMVKVGEVLVEDQADTEMWCAWSILVMK